MKPDVTILVASYNNSNYIEATLESIRKQTYSHFKVIIGEDGSTEDTAALIRPFLDDPRFTLFPWHPNRGVHTNAFFLLSQIDTPYWTWIGSDDILHPDFLERRLQTIVKHPLAAIVYGNARSIDSNGNVLAAEVFQNHPDKVLKGSDMLERLATHNVIPAMGGLCRTSVTKMVHGYFVPEWKFTQDWLFWILVAATGFDFVYDAVPGFDYRIHDKSLNNSGLSSPHESRKRYEIRLVPLYALTLASRYSLPAQAILERWGRWLFLLWVPVALKSILLGKISKREVAAAVSFVQGRSRTCWPLLVLVFHLPMALCLRIRITTAGGQGCRADESEAKES